MQTTKPCPVGRDSTSCTLQIMPGLTITYLNYQLSITSALNLQNTISPTRFLQLKSDARGNIPGRHPCSLGPFALDAIPTPGKTKKHLTTSNHAKFAKEGCKIYKLSTFFVRISVAALFNCRCKEFSENLLELLNLTLKSLNGVSQAI